MARNGYLRPPEEVDMAREERAIRRAGVAALLISGVAFAAGWYVLPRLFPFPTDLAERLAFGVQASAFVLLWVVAGVLMVSTGRRRSAADIGGSAAGPPSGRLAIKAAFLQNTLEQAVLAAGAYLALGTLLSGAWLSLIVVAVALFAVGRVLFYVGYPQGAGGRALGMTLTMTPTILGYLLAVVLVAMRLF